MHFNPFHRHNKLFGAYPDFPNWTLNFFTYLVGENDTFGVVDYCLIFSGLLKLCEDWDSMLWLVPAHFFHFIKLAIACVLTLCLLPFLYLVYACVRYQSIQELSEMQVLSVGQAEREFLQYACQLHKNGLRLSQTSISKEKLFHLVYSNKIIKLKHHSQCHDILNNNMKDFRLHKVAACYSSGRLDFQDTLFGLFDKNNLPVAFFIPNEGNKKGIAAMKRIDAFSCSDGWSYRESYRESYRNSVEDTIDYYCRQKDPLNFQGWVEKRDSTLFTPIFALEAAVENTDLAILSRSMDPLLAQEIMGFVGFQGMLEVNLNRIAACHSVFFKPGIPKSIFMEEEVSADSSIPSLGAGEASMAQGPTY